MPAQPPPRRGRGTARAAGQAAWLSPLQLRLARDALPRSDGARGALPARSFPATLLRLFDRRRVPNLHLAKTCLSAPSRQFAASQAFAVDIAAVDNKMRGLVAEALAKQGRSLRAQTSVENMVLRAVKNCGAADDLAENVAVTVSPENPTPGQAYTTVTDYTIREGVTITSGKAYYKATLSGFPIVNQSDDLCEDLKTGSTPCPLSGHVHSEETSDMPTGAHGTLSSTMRWTTTMDGAEKEILCLQFQYNL